MTSLLLTSRKCEDIETWNKTKHSVKWMMKLRKALEAGCSSESRVLAQRAQGPGVYTSRCINLAW